MSITDEIADLAKLKRGDYLFNGGFEGKSNEIGHVYLSLLI